MVEFGSPSDLLKIPNGELRGLVEADKRNKRKGGKQEIPLQSSSINITETIPA